MDVGCCHILAMNIGVQISVQVPTFNSFGYTPKNRIAGSYDTSMFNHVRKCWDIFHSGCIILHSPQQCMRVPVPLYPHQHLLFSRVYIYLAILVNAKWYLIIALICISLITTDVEHRFMKCIFIICISSLKKYLKSFVHFLFGLFNLLLLCFKCSIYILDINPTFNLKIFSVIH